MIKEMIKVVIFEWLIPVMVMSAVIYGLIKLLQLTPFGEWAFTCIDNVIGGPRQT